eukprot:3724528-Lingulodinium_polyedra.AAC.1
MSVGAFSGRAGFGNKGLKHKSRKGAGVPRTPPVLGRLASFQRCARLSLTGRQCARGINFVRG